MNHYRSVQSRFAGSVSRSAFFVSALTCLSMFVTPVFAQYIRTDLVSNQAGVAALQDEHLVNGWGLVALPQSPFWVSDNGTGFSTLLYRSWSANSAVRDNPSCTRGPSGDYWHANWHRRKH